jgi:hypothetical protein
LDATQPVSGAQLIVLSEHVDYWDHDGWKDPHSSAALTQRQVAYVQSLGLKTPYTPQIVVNGTSEVQANNPQQLQRVLQQAAIVPEVPVSIGDVRFEDGNPGVLLARIESASTSEKHNADIYVAIALDHVESQVLKGENGGQHLSHVAVLLELKKIGRVSKGKRFDETVQFKLKSGADPKNVRVVAFVQEQGPGLGRVLGAALRKPAT